MMVKCFAMLRDPTPRLQDKRLVKAAVALVLRRGEYGRHHVACALRTMDGRLVLGLHISANVGVGSICAESAAIAESLKARQTEIAKIVAIRRTFISQPATEIVPPCGRCRELIYEYGPNAGVILPAPINEFKVLPITDLLPMPFHRQRPDRRAGGHVAPFFGSEM